MTTNFPDNKKIAALITLLEDEDNSISTAAMKELLNINSCDLAALLKEYHESENVTLRKRVHQLQSIIRIRANRKRLANRLSQENSSLFQGLKEIHLLWYDRDNEEALLKQVDKFINKTKISGIQNFHDIALFMKKKDFSASRNSELEPDAYCIGAVLDTKIGTDIVLCGLMALIAESAEIKYNIVCRNNLFTIYDEKNNFIDPFTWEVERSENINIISNSETFSVGRVLRYIIYQLLLCAICSASFRYVYTIGKTVSDSLKTERSLDIFENPYNGKN